MNFRPVLAEAVMTGHKTVTRRLVSENPRSPYHPSRIGAMIGRRIAVCPGRGKPQIGKARVVSVGRHTLDPMRLPEAECIAEGFNSRSAFMGAWATIHRDLAPVDVWRIELEAVR